MKKLILTTALAMVSIVSNAQVGVLTISKNDDQIPIDFWYVIGDDKDFANQMMYYGKTSSVRTYLAKLLTENGSDISKPAGKDDADDPYWIVTYATGYVTYFYLLVDDTDTAYSWITTYSK